MLLLPIECLRIIFSFLRSDERVDLELHNTFIYPCSLPSQLKPVPPGLFIGDDMSDGLYMETHHLELTNCSISKNMYSDGCTVYNIEHFPPNREEFGMNTFHYRTVWQCPECHMPNFDLDEVDEMMCVCTKGMSTTLDGSMMYTPCACACIRCSPHNFSRVFYRYLIAGPYKLRQRYSREQRDEMRRFLKDLWSFATPIFRSRCCEQSLMCMEDISC